MIRTFSENDLLSTTATIINTHRADAHAKALDEEDEALLNYAFKYFEKALDGI